MTLPSPITAYPARLPRPRGPQAWRLFRWALVALMLVCATLAVTRGQQEAGIHQLERGLADGSITRVNIDGGLLDTVQGEATATVTWREGRRTRYLEARETRNGPATTWSTSSEHYVGVSASSGTLEHHLRESSHGRVTITRDHRPGSISGHVDVLSWRWQLFDWWAAAWAVCALLTFAALINGPEPRGMTRWGWFWFFVGPLGPLARLLYLFTSGRAAREDERRLSGGWAFAISIIVLNMLHFQR